MLRFSRAKIIATLGLILVGLMLAVPSFFSPEQRKGFVASLPSWFPSWVVPTRAIVLGLDLQGGSQLLLEVDQNELIASQAKALRDDVLDWRGWWRNRVSRTLLVFLLTNLGMLLGEYLAGIRILHRLM